MAGRNGKDALTDRERLFINAYLKNGCNAQQAAVESGYSAERNQSAYEVRDRPRVAAEIERRLKKADEEADITAREILLELKCLAMSNVADVFEDNGQGMPKFREWGKLPRHVTAALKEVTVETAIAQDGTKGTVERVKIKLHDKQGPLELLARYMKLIGEKNGSGDTTNTLIVFQNAVSAARAIATRVAGG